MDRRSFTLGVACLVSQGSSNAQGVLASLPPPNDKEIKKILEPERWPNPYVMVESGRYELVLPRVPRSSRRLTLAQLERALLALPAGAFPLGGVMGVGQSGLLREEELPAVDKARSDLVQLLRRYGVRADLWPSN